MQLLNDELLNFAHAIVRGDDLSPKINTAYPNYSSETAIAVYRNNYRGNLHDALAGIYPVIEQLVGEAFFRRLTRTYIEQHPSRSGNLYHYGEEMAAFIETFTPAKQLGYLADVAALEWACHRAHNAEDAALLEVSSLAQVSPEQYSQLTLIIHPGCHLLRSRYPIATIWQAHQPGAPDDFQIDLDSGASNALVFRNNDEVLVNELSGADAEWLEKIHSGCLLGAATIDTLNNYPELDLQACLANFVSQGLFTGFIVGEAP